MKAQKLISSFYHLLAKKRNSHYNCGFSITNPQRSVISILVWPQYSLVYLQVHISVSAVNDTNVGDFQFNCISNTVIVVALL